MDILTDSTQTLRNVKNRAVEGLVTRIPTAKRQTVKSLGSLRRSPLRPSTSIAQENSVQVDRVGKNGGKENIPPGYKCDSPTLERQKTTQVEKSGSVRSNVQIKTPGTGSSRPAAAQLANKPPQRIVLGDKGNAKSTTPRTSQITKNAVTTEHGRQQTPKTQKPALSKPTNCPKPSALPTVKAKKRNDEFLLTREVATPALVNSRLLHQEILITEFLNGLFEQTDGQQTSPGYAVTLRHELLYRYRDNFFALLCKRVQASLRYGALSVPRNVLARGRRLHQDIGLKRLFLDLWINTYDPRALEAALETVVGQRVAQHKEGKGGKGSSKNRLENFLETFLLRNEDMQAQEANTTAQAYRRTVLRGIMIITLLDKARTHPGTTLPRRLFLASSSMKSSAAVLQALARLLLPSSGDIIRSLGQLGGQVSYEQHHLGDYHYQIGNLAVDVRDGIRLARVVELLLYSPPLHEKREGLLSSNEEEIYPLTPQLKFPCTSRAAKLFNVQVALNAVSSKANGIAHDVKAEDIVDGHREKTIALLWRLVSSKWGFAGLVDWDDIRHEITRLKQRVINQLGHEHAANTCVSGITELARQHHDAGYDDDEYSECTIMLKQWTALLTQLNAFPTDDSSISFSDDWIFECIVGEYQGYILGGMECGGNLASRLQVLGYSPRFGNVYPIYFGSHALTNRNELKKSEPGHQHHHHNTPAECLLQRLNRRGARHPLLTTSDYLETYPRSDDRTTSLARDYCPTATRRLSTDHCQCSCERMRGGGTYARSDPLGTRRHRQPMATTLQR